MWLPHYSTTNQPNHSLESIILIILESNVLGREGGGVYILMSGLDVERGLGAAGSLG